MKWASLKSASSNGSLPALSAQRGQVCPRAGAASEDPHRPGLRLLRGRLQALPPRVQSKMAAAFQVFCHDLNRNEKKFSAEVQRSAFLKPSHN